MVNKDLERQHLLNQKIFSVISHDFRGPILSLNLVLNKFKDSSDNEKFNKYLKDINTSVHNANTVLNNLLNWAKTEIALESFDKSDCLVDEVVFKTELEFEEKLSEKNLELVKHISKDATVMLPHDILHIALRNLISNAIKFSTINSKIEIGFDEQKSELSVKDFGTGITEEKTALLFNGQVNAAIGTAKEEGFGIGLYIVSELLYKYGFKINAESKLNEGTTFSIVPK
jgi:signal transduction histidine kinase